MCVCIMLNEYETLIRHDSFLPWKREITLHFQALADIRMLFFGVLKMQRTLQMVR